MHVYYMSDTWSCVFGLQQALLGQPLPMHQQGPLISASQFERPELSLEFMFLPVSTILLAQRCSREKWDLLNHSIKIDSRA